MDEIVDWRRKTPEQYQQIAANIAKRKANWRQPERLTAMTEAEWQAARLRNRSQQ